jgi:poly(3-hydroxybutyrate) depolymerase
MKIFVLCLFMLSALTVTAQTQNIYVRGVVTDTKTGKVLPNATVTLLQPLLKDTTLTAGNYAIIKGTIGVLTSVKTKNGKISLAKGFLELNLTTPSNVKVEIFDVKGVLLKKEILQAAFAGIHHFNIAENNRAAKLLLLKVSIDDQTMTFRCLPEHNNNFSVNTSLDNTISVTSSKGLSKTAAAISDTLHIRANGYLTKMIPISSYDTTVNITLDSLYQGPSVGCGKTLATLKTGTYSITSAGLSRRYIIDVPTNYNPNHPYRLIFGMHCMCGSMWSVQSEKFYMLKRLADSTQDNCIFVAPSVYNGGNYNQSSWGCPVWDQNEKDHTFFDDMLKLFKDTLCVDTNRVFVAGFSYGAMFTNSLAQNHQKQLRAVACHATSFGGGIYVPKNTGLPIAWMGTVGMSDTRCPPSDGRACRDTVLKYNGNIKPTTVPETKAGSKTHVIYDYEGGIRPVKWCTADADHQWSEYDGGAIGSYDANKTWTAEVTWKFFTQF